jgi:hypothetical protein
LVVAARPFAERTEELLARWAATPTCVYLAGGSEVVLGVWIEPSETGAVARSNELLRGEVASWHQSIAADLHTPSIPVFFDYEGLWSHLSGVEGTVAYPRGLGGSPVVDEAVALTSHQSWAARELLHRPFGMGSVGRSGHLVGPLGLPFSQQKMVAQGTISHRIFLDPGRIPPFRGHAADQIVLVTGSWRSGARPETLFRALTLECRVFPFLYVVGSGRAVIGALGRSGGSAPSPEARRPVLATLQESLQGIEIHQVAAASARTVVDHRYDRLAPPEPA